MIRLIDANALKEAIRKRLGISSLKYLTEQEKVIVEEIDNAPTVKTYCYFCGQAEHGQIEERPQGEWDKRHTELLKYFVKCEKCGEEIMTSHKNFCPNCGAKTRKGG